ncbi:hypothetical protein POVWA2_017470 [Plasmodium ovale wallikeri]|uniref:Uncharacterized protein n=1 Tax=Plasmodium ovale wallikeri TaxID=864142 RepID=A0A1A8YPN8_PLAOA|nr:hypothetical protein POVWA1_017590 [Plasmodium ovale wallikeri]SBT33957.1 hypothetical protein POVWA2_017470 [Plasmodium ovale wallikeri]
MGILPPVKTWCAKRALSSNTSYFAMPTLQFAAPHFATPQFGTRQFYFFPVHANVCYCQCTFILKGMQKIIPRYKRPKFIRWPITNIVTTCTTILLFFQEN